MVVADTIPSPLGKDNDGVIRIGKTRVTLEVVIFAFNQGATPEEIVQRFPVLSLSEVYGTIAYYLQHKAEVDSYVNERRRTAQEIRAANEVLGIRERLLARRTEKRGE